ncbi:YHS domain-containing (seleno)protein [Dyadobacter fanqingshengii]|uniref:YHS domain protein n=1 Tax=Dyadobacter fanqingshengii TaxID=2906443 RepID=A0A9X1TA54_9BACT|nr:YHS domain-containing (seleno)protein [Dyadobacter fanqingshengii]MCF0042140.1 YHS domain protein [Dyadobacter fanqingshengii]USJ35326.1 YHS domain protein [Dyadobacter fanqingshengii]
MRKIILATTFILTALGSYAQKSEIFAPGGKAIKGYDVVAFFKDAGPVAGADSLSYQYKDAQWLFANRANLDAFKANPDMYMPQYGGYCAYGTSQGHKAPTETDTWTIVNDKLYFNYNQKVKENWSKKRDELIRKADTEWPLIKDKQ